MGWAIPVDHSWKIKESEKVEKYLDTAREFLKNLEHESDGDTNCIWYTWNSSQEIKKGIGTVGK